MPSRRHPKQSSPAPAKSAAPAAATTGRDPAEMFAAALKESEARDKATRDRQRREAEEAAAKKAAERAQADALAAARKDLDRAIQAVRDAKRNGRSTVEADAAWKAAKAKVIELETGTAPTWAPPAPVTDTDHADGESGDETDSDASDSPLDDGAVGEEQA